MRVEGRTKRIDKVRISLLVIALLISIFVGFKFGGQVQNNEAAISTVVTIFSILAGFLIAVITFISEPATRPDATWQSLQIMRATIQRKIIRQIVLFYLYLATLGLAIAMFLVPDTELLIKNILGSIFLGLSTFVFIMSFTLPMSLTRTQQARYDDALASKRPDDLNRALGAAGGGDRAK